MKSWFIRGWILYDGIPPLKCTIHLWEDPACSVLESVYSREFGHDNRLIVPRVIKMHFIQHSGAPKLDCIKNWLAHPFLCCFNTAANRWNFGIASHPRVVIRCLYWWSYQNFITAIKQLISLWPLQMKAGTVVILLHFLRIYIYTYVYICIYLYVHGKRDLK